ncbi:MAG: hypothetical protein M3Z08_12830 [Chloroflexota bacterium]|nr:hypothetical protein [Chloroflexota bacterium]
MTRKDSEKDAERPHYYSQFWLDVAAGRRIIGGPKSDEETDLAEPEVVEIAAPRRGGRVTTVPDSDGHIHARIQPEVDDEAEAEFEDELDSELEVDEDELADEVDDQELPNILIDETDIPAAEVAETAVPEAEVAETAVPEAEVAETAVPLANGADVPVDEEAEATDEEDLFEEEEEEDDDLWPSGRGRKKPKPGRQVKPPKKPKRDTRRGY